MLHLEEHRKELSGAKVYTCKTCSKEFKMAGQLKEHTKTHIKMRLESEGTVAQRVSGLLILLSKVLA